jgi:hypothetical protein
MSDCLNMGRTIGGDVGRLLTIDDGSVSYRRLLIVMGEKLRFGFR